MPVSKEILQQILKEYEDRRAAEKLARENRQKEVYERLPEVKTIDDEIESFSLSAMGAYLKCGKDPHKALSRLRQRMDELKERREALLLGAGYPTDYMETRYACPLCKDTGYVQYEKCRCLKQELINRAYHQSGLERILERENMACFDLSLFEDRPVPSETLTPRQNMQQILKRVQGFLGSFSENPGQNLLFSGPTGTGKTFLCNCVAKELLDQGYTVLYVTAYDLCALLEKERFQDRVRSPRLSFTSETVESCDLLILDDLGTEFRNTLSVTELFHCVNQRLLARRSTLISTNLTFADLGAAYGDRFSSRIFGSYTFCRFIGPDLRRKKRLREEGAL